MNKAVSCIFRKYLRDLTLGHDFGVLHVGLISCDLCV
jgi:hypothetical protein